MRRHLTFANIVSMLALFIALGGISWAAATLPKNSVGSKQLKKNAVINSKIKKNAVTGAKVKANTLTGSDVNESTLAQVPSAATARAHERRLGEQRQQRHPAGHQACPVERQ